MPSGLVRSANESANPSGATLGEKFARVVGLGASRDNGGLELGFRIGGDNGNGVRDVKFCLPIGEVTVDGGEIGKVLCG